TAVRLVRPDLGAAPNRGVMPAPWLEEPTDPPSQRRDLTGGRKAVQRHARHTREPRRAEGVREDRRWRHAVVDDHVAIVGAWFVPDGRVLDTEQFSDRLERAQLERRLEWITQFWMAPREVAPRLRGDDRLRVAPPRGERRLRRRGQPDRFDRLAEARRERRCLGIVEPREHPPEA